MILYEQLSLYSYFFQCSGTNVGKNKEKISIQIKKIRATNVGNGGKTYGTGMNKKYPEVDIIYIDCNLNQNLKL